MVNDLSAPVTKTMSKAKTLPSKARAPHVLMLSGSTPFQRRKTAAMMAKGWDLDLYTVDLSQVASQYIGETEKNLRRIFERAERSEAILFFDEADALFGARTAVKDAQDRYANLDVSDLLKHIQRHKGLVIVTTNHKSNIDRPFLRRVHVAAPGEAAKKMWTKSTDCR
jgi:vesicle-fusing ATPase